MPASLIKKHSIVIGGKKSSLSLEKPFWRELQRMAAEAGMTTGQLAARIYAASANKNRSSAVRLAVLADLQATIAVHSGVSSVVASRSLGKDRAGLAIPPGMSGAPR